MTPRDTRWFMLGFLLGMCSFPLLASTLGCGRASATTSIEAQTELEILAIAETARISSIAGQSVSGVITTHRYVQSDEVCKQFGLSSGCVAFAWYDGQIGRGARGTVYWYKDRVNGPDSGRDAIVWSAAHEVCHSVTGFGHDDRHAICNLALYKGQSPWRE